MESRQGHLKVASPSRTLPPEKVWRDVWTSLLPDTDPLSKPILNWLCTPGLRTQVGAWIGGPGNNVKTLANQIRSTRPRYAKSSPQTVLSAAQKLMDALLDPQSTSTRALLKNILKGTNAFGGKSSQFPGRLDEGIRVMGSWDHDGRTDPPKTLYTGKPDIVLALFNSPFGPDVLITTDRLSEGVDLHRYCRHLIHYELDPSPARTLQRNGRVRRFESWASVTGQPIQYAYPTFGGTRDEKVVAIMRQRINAFGLLLGGAPNIDPDEDESNQGFAETVLRRARKDLESLNRRLRP